MKKLKFIFKIMLLTVLMATAKSLYAIDANVKSELLARYPSMSSLSDTQLDKVVNLLRRFPGLKNLNQQDIDSIKERIEDRRASGNRVLGSGRVIKKLIEVNPDLLANIDPGRFRMRLSQNARGAPIILDDVAAEFEGLSRNEKRDLWLSKNPMERIEILKAIKAKAETLEGWEEGKRENNRELLVNYVYEEKLTDTEKERYEKYYATCTPNNCKEADKILKDLTGDDWDPKCNEGAGCHKDGNEQNWKMFWMMPPESRRAFYHKINGGNPHFDGIADPNKHKDEHSIDPNDDKYVGIDNVKFPELWVEGVQGTHMKCDHDANKFWRAFSEQYPRAWEGWFKENIWNQDLNPGTGNEIQIPTWDPSNFPSDKLKDRLKDLIGRWPPLPPDLELPSKEEIKEIIQQAFCDKHPKRCGVVERPEPEIEIGQLVGNFCENNPQACLVDRPEPEFPDQGIDRPRPDGILVDKIKDNLVDKIKDNIGDRISSYCETFPERCVVQRPNPEGEIDGRPTPGFEIGQIVQSFCENNPQACLVDRPEPEFPDQGIDRPRPDGILVDKIKDNIADRIASFCQENADKCVVERPTPELPPIERPTPEIDRDKIQNLIGFLQGQEKPGWDPLPPVIEPEMEDIIAILQNYQRVETPNAEELLKRSKKTTRGSKGPNDVSE